MANALTKAQFTVVVNQLKKDGQLTTSGILREAKKKTSPLHNLFEWDDSVAAKQYRKQQAMQLIKRANVSIEAAEDKIIHVPVKRGEGAYKTTKTVVNNISEFDAALSAALKSLSAAEHTVEILKEVAEDESPDNAGILAIALEGLKTCNTALRTLH